MIKPETGIINCVRKTAAETRMSAETLFGGEGEIKKPLSLAATAFLTGKESGEGNTLLKVKVVFSFVYLAEDGYKKTEATAETSGAVSLSDPAVVLSTEDVRIVNSPDGYIGRCRVVARCFHSEAEEKEVLVGGEDIYIKEKTIVLDAGTGISADTLHLEDEFEVGYPVSEVLLHRESVTVGEVVSGISSVALSGDINLTLNMLPLAENGEILKEKRTIPFRHEVENVGALPNMRAYGYAEIKKVSVKVVADEAKGKSVVTAEITLALSGEAVDQAAMTVAEDVYSKNSYIEAETEEIYIDKFVGQYLYEEKCVAPAGEAPEGGRLIAATGENISVLKAETENGKLALSGILKADAIFKNADNGTTALVVEAPFAVETEVAGEALFAGVTVEDFSIRLRGGAIETEFTLKAAYKLYEKEKIKYVARIAEQGAKEANESAISVYIPKAGDDLWEVAKTLGESKEEVMRYNPELEFPLTGDERIIIYRQKT